MCLWSKGGAAFATICFAFSASGADVDSPSPEPNETAIEAPTQTPDGQGIKRKRRRDLAKEEGAKGRAGSEGEDSDKGPARESRASGPWSTGTLSPLLTAKSQTAQWPSRRYLARADFVFRSGKDARPSGDTTTSLFSHAYQGTLLLKAEPKLWDAGIEWHKTYSSYKVKAVNSGTTAVFRGKTETTELAPFVTYSLLNRLVLGLSYHLAGHNEVDHRSTTDRSVTIAPTPKIRSNYTYFVPSLTLLGSSYELTLEAKPRVKDETIGGQVDEAGYIAITSQYRMATWLAFGARLEWDLNALKDSGEKNTVELVTGAEASFGRDGQAGLFFRFHPPYAAVEAKKDSSNVQHFGLIGTYERPWDFGLWGVMLDGSYGFGKSTVEAYRERGDIIELQTTTTVFSDLTFDIGLTASQYF